MTTIHRRPFLPTMRSAIWTMALLTTWGAARNVVAAESDQAQARIYKQAKAAYDADKLQDCKRILQSAGSLSPIMTLLLAQAECELHEYLACATHAGESLKWTEHSPATRKGIDAMLTEAVREVGIANLAVNVDGAEASVDGQMIGATPFNGPIYLEPGTRKLSVAKSGYTTITREVEARKGVSVHLKVDLPEEPKANPPVSLKEPDAPKAPLADPNPKPNLDPFREPPRESSGPNLAL